MARAQAEGISNRPGTKKAAAQCLCSGLFVDGALLWEWRARQQCGAACNPVKKLQIQLAGEFVDDVVSCALLGLDVYLAGLHTDLVSGAVVCFGAVDDIGDVVLLTAHLHIQLGCQRRAAAAGGSLGGFAGLALGSRSIGCGSGNFLFRHDA